MCDSNWQRSDMARPERKDSRLDLRVTQEKRRRYEAAAAAEGSTVTSFIEAAADSRAAHVLADRRMFALNDESWTRRRSPIRG